MKQIMLVNVAALVVAIVSLQASTLPAQQALKARSLQFEVAAVKAGNPQLGVYSSSSTGPPGGVLRMVNVPLKQWIEIGLSVRDYALKAPPWLDTTRFDLDARLPDETPVNHETIAKMMKALLVGRFGLKWHEEVETVSGYELVTEKKVLVKPSSMLERMKGHGSSSGPSFIGGWNISTSELAEALAVTLGRPVVDTTHLSGVFNIKLMWSAPDDAMATERKRYGIDGDNLPSSLFTALREQLGLRLQSARVPSKVVVVDYINRLPSSN